jgi:hypothetical protein
METGITQETSESHCISLSRCIVHAPISLSGLVFFPYLKNYTFGSYGIIYTCMNDRNVQSRRERRGNKRNSAVSVARGSLSCTSRALREPAVQGFHLAWAGNSRSRLLSPPLPLKHQFQA